MSKAGMSGKLAEKLYSDNVRNALSVLNPTGDIRERQKEYLAKKLLLLTKFPPALLHNKPR